MTKLKEVARAIFDAQEKLHSDNRKFENAAIWRKQECLVAASAAVEALREPSIEVLRIDVEFTRSGNDETNSIYELFPDELGVIWRKMIDAILNEPTKE